MSSTDVTEPEEEKHEDKFKSRYTQTLIQCKPEMSDKEFINMLKEEIAQDLKETQEENEDTNAKNSSAMPYTQSD